MSISTSIDEVVIPSQRKRRKRYPTYSKTGVAWIPEIPTGWTIKRLRFALTFPNKGEIRGLPDDRQVSFVPMEAVGEYGGLNLEVVRPISDVLNGYTYFRDGDVIVAKITPCFENGKGALAEGLEGGIGFGTTELHVLRAGPEFIPRFLFYLTLGEHFRKLGTGEMYGAGGQKRVPERFLKDLRHPVPPLEEQRAIAAFLDRETAKIDELIAKKQRLNKALAERESDALSQLLVGNADAALVHRDTGMPWIPTIPSHWEIAELRRIVRAGTSITYGIVQAGPDFEGGIPYIRTSDMAGYSLPLEGYPRTSPDIDRAYRRSKVFYGDIVIAIRATVGKALPLPAELDGANLTQGTAKVSPGPRITRDFLLLALNSQQCQQRFAALAKGATFREITLDMLRRFPVPLPPLDEQERLVRRANEIATVSRRLAERVTNGIAQLGCYRASLISAAVTGQIDVRQWREEAQCP